MPLKLLKVFFATLLALFIAFIVRIYTYDAYHFWSLKDPLNARYSSNARVQNAAFINHLDFDSVILGNSHMENTSAKEASDIFGGKFFNLSMSGSNNYERSIVLKRVLETHNIKKVILLLTPSWSTEGYKTYPIESWNYLYDPNCFNDFVYYLNTHDVVCMWTFSKKSSCLGRKKNLDRPYAWFNNPQSISRFNGIENWTLNDQDPVMSKLLLHRIPDAIKTKPILRPSSKNNHQEEIHYSMYRDLFYFTQAYPDTKFFIFFNPDSILAKALYSRIDGWFNDYSIFVRYITQKADESKNVYFFGFDNLPFTNDLSNYKDHLHYKKEINNELLFRMGKNLNRLHHQNVDVYLKELCLRIKQYNMEEVYTSWKESQSSDTLKNCKPSTGL